MMARIEEGPPMFLRQPPPGPPTLSDQLRAALAAQLAGGRSIYRLGRMAGCDPSLVSRFLSGKRRLTSATMDKLGVALDLGLTRARPPAPVPDGEELPRGV